MSEKFDADAVAAQVGSRLWRYLSQAAAISDMSAVAANLFGLPRDEMTRLTAAHLAESDATGLMLEAAPRVLRDLPASVDRSEVETRGRIRQPVVWTRTRRRQYVTGDPQRYICRPPERAYDTSLARLAVLVLDRCAELPDLARLGQKGALGTKVGARAAEARKLRGHVKLSDVRRVDRLPDRTLASLGRYRAATPLIDWARICTEALDDRTPRIIREVIEERLLPPSQPSRLFELFVGFRLVDALVALGFSEVSQRLVPNRAVPFARLRSGPQELEVYWQRSLWGVAGVAHDGRYKAALDEAAITTSQLRPDFVLRLRNPDRLAFVEVKLTEGEDATPERHGIRDALLYAHDAESLFGDLPHPHGLVVAWNATARPGPGRFVVAGQGGIGAAAKELLAGWGLS